MSLGCAERFSRMPQEIGAQHRLIVSLMTVDLSHTHGLDYHFQVAIINKN
jgi:hypothetical protein